MNQLQIFALCLLFCTLSFVGLSQNIVLLPVQLDDRKDISKIQLTAIGEFGILRKSRPQVPAHLHTGVDIKRPSTSYIDEPIFPITYGIVISVRNDGPYAQIIIEHSINDEQIIWSVYEHVAGIKVDIGDEVVPFTPLARFMNRDELNNFGWQFDHLHLEIMKIKPKKRQPVPGQPQLLYNTYALTCYTEEELIERYFHPIIFLSDKF